MTGRVLCVGLATLDVIQLVERLPGSNEKIVSLDSVIAAGGPATNAAVAAAHLGNDVLLLTALTEHPVSNIIRADLTACGVTVRTATSDVAPITASILVTRDSGDRAIVSPTSSATQATVASPSEADIDDLLSGVSAVHLDGYYPSLALPIAVSAHERGIPVLFDGGSHKPHTDAVLSQVDVAVVSGDFAPPGVSPDPVSVLAYLVERGPSFAAVTRGARGIVFRGPQSRGAVPVERVPVADTLGAGDFFHGAFAVAIAQSGVSDHEFSHQLAWASRVAGASLRSFGTRAWLTS